MPETTEWFNFGKDSRAVRVLEKDNQRWMPLSDIATCIGYDRSGLNKLIDQNADLFSGMKGVVVTTTPGGSQELVCLNRDGVVGILMKLSYSRIKDETRKQKVVQFQKWAVGVLNEVIKNNGNVPKGVVVTTTTCDPVQIAIDKKRLAKVLNADAHDLIVAAYLKHDLGYLTPHVPPHDVIMRKAPAVPSQRVVAKSQTVLPAAEPPLINSLSARNMIAPSPKPEGMLSATDIGRIIGKTAEQVNQWLYNKKWILKDSDNPGEWVLDPQGYGVILGEMVPYKPHPAAKTIYRIFWKQEILEKFNVKV